MSDESRYRVEDPDEVENDEPRGLLRPLPTVDDSMVPQRGVPMVSFLGIMMSEESRDRLVMILMPFLTAILYTAIYAAIIIDVLPDNSNFMFFIPLIIAIPIGMTVPQLKHTLISAVLSAVFFVILLMLFLAIPGILVPEVGISEFIVSGIFLTLVYFFFIVFAALLGAFIGILLREFF